MRYGSVPLAVKTFRMVRHQYGVKVAWSGVISNLSHCNEFPNVDIGFVQLVVLKLTLVEALCGHLVAGSFSRNFLCLYQLWKKKLALVEPLCDHPRWQFIYPGLFSRNFLCLYDL